VGLTTDKVFYTLTGKGRFELNAILGSWADGVGKCDLVSLDVVYLATSAGKVFQFGICESGSGASVTQLAMKENGIYFVSTPYTVGQRAVKNILPDTNVSRQIRPVSSNLMMMSIQYDVGTEVQVQLVFNISVSTVRMHYLKV
jgi:hypothetical protein